MNFKKGIMYVFISNIINLIINLFTGFVLPKLLSIESYANIKLFQLYITYIGILHLGFADGMYLKNGGKSIKEINSKEILNEFKTFKIFQFVITIIAVTISIVFKNKILLFCSIVILPINVGNYIRNLYQAIGEFKRYSKFTNINTILSRFESILSFDIKSIIKRQIEGIMISLVITVNHKYLFFKTGLILLLAIIIPVIIILRGVFILPIRLNGDDIRLGIFI